MTSSGSQPGVGDFARGATVFGRCVVDRCIRRDRLASVFAAHDRERVSEWFTVWSVRADQVSRRPGAAERFSDEMERMRAIRHSSLPVVVSWDCEGPAPLVLAGMRRGRSLRDVIIGEPFVSIEDVARVVIAVGDALEALHDSVPAVMHLGVCPERVVICDDGGVWLEEPGYLHALVSSGYLTATQAVMYAQPGYVIPAELLTPPSPSADVFQLAVMAFEALTGQLPFGAVGQADLPALLRVSYLPSAAALRPGLTPDTDAVFNRVWRGALGGEQDSAATFARDLVRVLGEDRSLRPTFPGGVLPDASRRKGRAPAPGPGAMGDGHIPRPIATAPTAPDNFDRAFDDMLRVDDALHGDSSPVIEFTPAVVRLDPSIAVAGVAPVVDVTSVKPTLVGATGIRLSTHPPPARGSSDRPQASRHPLDDHPTPAVGYERLKLLAGEPAPAVESVEVDAIDLTADAEPEATPAHGFSPDATSRIEQEVLDVLRRTASPSQRTEHAPRAPAGHAMHSGTVPRARVSERAPTGHRRNDEVPPPPSAATRPSATPLRPKSPTPHAGTASTASGSARPSGHGARASGEIPPPPKLPADALSMFSGSPRARVTVSAGPELDFSDASSVEAAPIDELSTQDIVEEVLPAAVQAVSHGQAHSASPPAPPPEASAGHHHDVVQPAASDVAVHARESVHPPPSPAVSVAAHPPHAAKPHAAPVLAPLTMSVATSPLRAPTPKALSAPVPARSSSPGPAPRASAVPIERERRTEPPPPQQVDSAWLLAARVLGTSTVIASLLVTAGLVYMRPSMDALRDEVARLRVELADASTGSAPSHEEVTGPSDAALEPTDATTPDESVEVADAEVLSLDDAAQSTPALTADVTVAPVDAGPPPSVLAHVDAATGPMPGVPNDTARVRLMGQLRAGVSDCVEGVEDPRFVVVSVRFDTTGIVSRVRLHGIFQEPPLGPCLEEVVRRAHVDPFPAPFWDVDLRFAVPPPRWRPPT